jgi:hypothetical protein
MHPFAAMNTSYFGAYLDGEEAIVRRFGMDFDARLDGRFGSKSDDPLG